MHSLYLVYTGSLIASMLTSTLLAGLLWIKGGQTAGRIPLILFCLGNASWTLGHWLIQSSGSLPAVSADIGVALVDLSPCVAAVYLHFALVFSHQKKCLAMRAALAAGYISTVLISLTAIVLRSGTIAVWLGFSHFYFYTGFAWVVALSTVFLSGTGHWVLFQKFRSANGKYKRQLLAVLCSGIWGLCASSGLLHASVGLNVFPYQVLLLPAYTLFLVYGILRYELMAFNRWFRQGLTWVLLLAVISLVVTLLMSLLVKLGITDFHPISLGIIWLGTLISFLIAYGLYQPLQKLATRWVYPGAELDAARLDHWRERLSEGKNWQQLKKIAEQLFAEHVQHAAFVEFAGIGAGRSESINSAYDFVCSRSAGTWLCEARQQSDVWDAATPGVRFSGEVFAAMLTSAANQLQQALELADERAKQLQQSHLAELGRLSASIAHELRNPLNIIAMANTGSEVQHKPEIDTQLDRANRLVTELLDYAGEIKIHKENINIADICSTVLSLYEQVHNPKSDCPVEFVMDVSSEMFAYADPHKLQQVLVNLIDNAIVAVKPLQDPVICIQAVSDERGVRIKVCDNGSGIEQDNWTSIFQPFCGGYQSGTGLGLAIVKRITDAHGGSIHYRPLNPAAGQWFSSCFEIFLPKGSEILSPDPSNQRTAHDQ